MANVVLWIRAGQSESQDAKAFLKQHGYAADAVRDATAQPPDETERQQLVAAAGAGPAPFDLAGHLRTPTLVTPKGILVGFRERRWREFLDIGKGR